MPPTITFEPPGPGSWMLDATHHGRRPVTPYFQPFYERVFLGGMPQMLERYGLPLAGFKAAYVHGCSYVRPMGVGEPEEPKGSQPPAFVFKILSRIHPELRRRNRTARAAWQERRWREDVDRWFGGLRQQAMDANLTIQAELPSALDDRELVDHLVRATANFESLALASFATHGGDLIPVGDYLAHCTEWGIDHGAAAALLAGASPASLETSRMLAPVADALASAPTRPSSVEEVRALGAEVDMAVSAWLDQHGWRLLFSDDLDTPVLAEAPALQLRALLSATDHEPPPPDPSPIRGQLPADDRDRFDEVLAEARYGLRLRDDNVGVGWNWPAGLVRRALLEVGRRMADRGQLDDPEHVLLLVADEIGPLLIDKQGPSREDVTDRAAYRQAVIESHPPLTLGPDGGEPPADAFPAPLRRATKAILTMIGAMNGEDSAAPLHGTGVGDRTYRGRARVLPDAAAAFDRLEEGDVVVTPFTGPAWNSLLPMFGAVVVEEGGPMCHAAIVAREFGIPALVGVTGASSQIPDGAEVEVDPVAGEIRII